MEKNFLKNHANFSPSVGHNLRNRRVIVNPKTTTITTTTTTTTSTNRVYISEPLNSTFISSQTQINISNNKNSENVLNLIQVELNLDFPFRCGICMSV